MPLGKICATFHFRVDPESSPSQEWKKSNIWSIQGEKWLLESVLYRVKSAFYIRLKKRRFSLFFIYLGIDSLRSGEYVYVSGAADQGHSFVFCYELDVFVKDHASDIFLKNFFWPKLILLALSTLIKISLKNC